MPARAIFWKQRSRTTTRCSAPASTLGRRFQNYYKDLSQRLKKRELDIVIVVNMFLTGFDATASPPVADKNLKAHGLIQAYSRTNRILNSVKTYGNIVSFRNLEQATNDALPCLATRTPRVSCCSSPTPSTTRTTRSALVSWCWIPAGKAIVGEAAQKAFIKLFGSILRLKNIRPSTILPGFEILTSTVQTTRPVPESVREFRATSAAERSISDVVVFEIELIKQVEINVDYILLLVERYLKKKGGGDDKEIRAIERAINSSPSLRNKKDLIEQFVDSVNTKAKVDAQWQAFVAAKKVGNWSESSPRRISTPRPRAASSTALSVTAASPPRARPSRRFCHRYRGSPRTTDTPPKSRRCSTGWQPSSSGILGWREDTKNGTQFGKGRHRLPEGTARGKIHCPATC